MSAPAGKATLCLWFDGEAEAAARFYAETFPDTAIAAIHRAPGDFPGGKAGNVITVEFTLLGMVCIGLNGGPMYRHSPAFSIQVATHTQEETDRYWRAITSDGGEESRCGWCKDRWGISWQITPRALTEGMKDPEASKRVFAAMITMGKIDIAAIEAARRG